MTPEAASRDRREPCGVGATDLNGYKRSCRLPAGHGGVHACDDSPGTPTGAASWTWDKEGDTAQRGARSNFFDLQRLAASQPSPSAVPEAPKVGGPTMMPHDDPRRDVLPPSAPEDIEGHAALSRAIEKAHQQWSLCDDFRCNGILDHDAPIREAVRALASSPVAPTEGLRIAEVLKRLGWQQPGPGTTSGTYADPDAAFIANAREVAAELATPGIAALPALDVDRAAILEWAMFWLALNREPCRADHRGYCQNHSLTAVGDTGRCITGRAMDAASRLATTTEETTDG